MIDTSEEIAEACEQIQSDAVRLYEDLHTENGRGLVDPDEAASLILQFEREVSARLATIAGLFLR